MTEDLRQMITDSPFKMIIRTLLASLTVVGYFFLSTDLRFEILCVLEIKINQLIYMHLEFEC